MPDLSKRKAAADRSRQRKKDRFTGRCDGCGKKVESPGNYRPAACWECLQAMNRGHGNCQRPHATENAPGAA